MLLRPLIRRSVFSAVAAVLLAAAPAGRGATAQLRLLDLAGHEVDPFANTQAKALVFLFVRTDCPISNRYAPEVRRLYQKFADSGVAFGLVYADADETVAMIRRHVKAYDYRLDVLRDPRHALVRLAGVRVTPEAAVFVAGRVAYRGRIDDRFVSFARSRPAPTTRDLEMALEAILAGKPVANPVTTAIGCFIPDL